MVRPKKQPAEKRSEALACRLTPSERLRIERAAAHAGVSPSEYIRNQALTGRVNVPARRTLDPAAFDQVRRIGVNLNQLTRLAHRTGRVDREVRQAAATVERLVRRAIDGDIGAAPDGDPDERDGS
ncbi:MAG: plasmid mobilization protein [bacterium]